MHKVLFTIHVRRMISPLAAATARLSKEPRAPTDWTDSTAVLLRVCVFICTFPKTGFIEESRKSWVCVCVCVCSSNEWASTT